MKSTTTCNNLRLLALWIFSVEFKKLLRDFRFYQILRVTRVCQKVFSTMTEHRVGGVGGGVSQVNTCWRYWHAVGADDDPPGNQDPKARALAGPVGRQRPPEVLGRRRRRPARERVGLRGRRRRRLGRCRYC